MAWDGDSPTIQSAYVYRRVFEMEADKCLDGFDKQMDAGSYDEWAETYAHYIELLSRPLAERLVKLAALRPGDRVLDVGCGSGIASRAASQAIAPAGEVLGVDLSEGMVRAAERRGTPVAGARLKYRVMDAEHLDLDSESFDSVISLCAVLHFPNLRAAVSEMRRVLRPGGNLILSYGHVRPVRLLDRLIYFARRGVEEVASPLRPTLRAPEAILRIASEHFPPDAEPEEAELTAWSLHHPETVIRKELMGAGFRDVQFHSCRHEVGFTEPEEYWKAQRAIVTRLRKRLTRHPRELEERIREAFICQAQSVLARGGKLLYPYGCLFISGTL